MSRPDTCDNCGAMLNAEPVPAVDGGFDRPCIYCGARNHESGPAQAAPHAPSSTGSATPARSAGLWVGLGLGAVAIVAGIVALTASRASSGAKSAGSAAVPRKDDPSWEPNGGPPVLANIRGAEAVVGPLRHLGKDDQLYVGAFDGATLAKRWQVGPFGTYSQGYPSTHFAVCRAHVAVSDFHARLHLYDLETGLEQHTVTLTDKVARMCAAPDGSDAVWIGQVDRKRAGTATFNGLLVDLTTGTATETTVPEPKGCGASLAEQAGVNTGFPMVAGLETRRQFELGKDLVLYGKKSPGTPTPTVALLDPATQPPRFARVGAPWTGAPAPLATVSWRVPLPSVDLATVRETYQDDIVGLCGKRFVGAYGEGEKIWHVAALDAESGARLWDTKLEPIFSVDTLGGLVCSAARAYVVRMDSVDVLDLTNGKLVGTIGHETYESDVSR